MKLWANAKLWLQELFLRYQHRRKELFADNLSDCTIISSARCIKQRIQVSKVLISLEFSSIVNLKMDHQNNRLPVPNIRMVSTPQDKIMRIEDCERIDLPILGLSKSIED